MFWYNRIAPKHKRRKSAHKKKKKNNFPSVITICSNKNLTHIDSQHNDR